MTIRPARRWVAALALLLLTVIPAPATARSTPADLLPDLRMGRLTGFVLRMEDPSEDAQNVRRRLLRFTTDIVNVGKGAFDVRGQRCADSEPLSTCLSRSTMTTRQRIYNDAGGYRVVDSAAVMKYQGDGHEHWHIQRMQTYELFSLDDPGAPLAKGAKRNFCFFDIRRPYPGLEGSPDSRVYQEELCLGNDRAQPWNSRRARMGLSVGWLDSYPTYFTFQWIDTTGLPDGRYRVCVTVDKQGFYRELNAGNNQAWQNLVIDWDAPDPADRFRLGSWGRSSCQTD